MIGRMPSLTAHVLLSQGAQWRFPEAEPRTLASLIGQGPLGAVTTERLAGIASICGTRNAALFGRGALTFLEFSFVANPDPRYEGSRSGTTKNQISLVA